MDHPTLTAEDFDHLRHANGIGKHIPRDRWGYRDHFCPGEDDLKSMNRLASAGLMTRTHAAGFESIPVFVTTEKGRRLFGLEAKP